MTSRGEEIFVGAIALALVVLVALRIVRGLRTGRLPIYRSYLDRSDDQAKFTALLLVHGVILSIMLFIAADLLLGLGFRSSR